MVLSGEHAARRADVRRSRAGGGSSLAAWHAAWAVTAASMALGGSWLGQLEGPALYGLLVMGVPGLAGLGLGGGRTAGGRGVLMGLWCAAAVVASAASGGMTGPLAGLMFMPLAAGLALGGHQNAAAGALGASLAVTAGLASAAVGGPAPLAPDMQALTAVVVMGAAALGMRMTWAARDARLAHLESASARLEQVLAGQPGLLLVVEPSGRVVAGYGAPPVGVPWDAVLEAGLTPAMRPADRPLLLGALLKAANGVDAALDLAPAAAPERRLRAVFRRLDGGAPTRLVAHIQDMTADHDRLARSEAARLDAETREAGKTRFLANMSHELRTPLNAVLGFSDIMRQRLFGPLPDRYAEYAESIHQAGGHLLDLINDVLDVSKIEAERYALTLERFDARDASAAASALMRVGAKDKGVSLSVVAPHHAVAVEADRRAVKQIMLNLLSNAVKFTPAGGAVTLTLEAVGRDLEIIVADTGVGIAAEDLQRLGRPFEQAGGAEQRAQGTGLGLSLVRAFAELHGGSMSIDSTLGEGSAVTVRLPVLVAAAHGSGAEIIPLPLAGRF